MYHPKRSKFSPGGRSVRKPNIPCPLRSVKMGCAGAATGTPQPEADTSTIEFQLLDSFPLPTMRRNCASTASTV